MILEAVNHHVERQIAELSLSAQSENLLAQLLEKFLVMPPCDFFTKVRSI